MRILVLFFLLAEVFVATTGFFPPQPQFGYSCRGVGSRLFLAGNNGNRSGNYRVIVVGKIILDKYGDPQTRIDDSKVTIGGGGPQAAWGACAGLAVRDLLSHEQGETKWGLLPVENRASSPPKQRVNFFGPIGLKNWTPEMTDSLSEMLPMLQTPPILITSNEHITPTINIWHDENEIVNWMPVNGSFSEEGADGLWRNRPSARDILDALNGYDGDVILHAILEAGNKSAGQGLDALPFFDSKLMNRVSGVGIEPIVFPDEATGLVSHEDAAGVRALVTRVAATLSASNEAKQAGKLLMVSPDRPCYDALLSNDDFSQGGTDAQETEFAVRNGASGSFIDDSIVPPATLGTPDGAPVNPTGAGNAYSGAYAACRATGSSALEAAILANAVGAAVCEYEHLPPWRWDVLERVAEAACEVRGNYFQSQNQ